MGSNFGMMLNFWDLTLWVAITFVTPLIIALLPIFKIQISEFTLHLMLGFSAGILGGVTFVDILPEAYDFAREMSLTSLYVSLGVGIGFFVLLIMERYFLVTEEAHGGHFHIHGKPMDPNHALIGVSALTFHGFMDGLVIPVGFSAGIEVGTVVTFAIAIHQIPDSFAALSLALSSTQSRKQAILSVLATAVDTPLGIAVGFLLVGLGSFMIPLGLGLCAGSFVYISAVDLVPELQHKARSQLVVVFMIIGFLLIAAISLLLPHV
ncbi:ZIP family metal transporter [Candidatus Bathyarchaeota archaeon]|nr:ZIP family metal transporter [Candidatus Bathyarchaeota archaeon]